jgi:hypothetical protein
MEKPSKVLPEHHHVPDVRQPAAQAVITDGQNN